MKKLFLILCALVLCSSSYAGNIKDIKKVIARKNAGCTIPGAADVSYETTDSSNTLVTGAAEGQSFASGAGGTLAQICVNIDYNGSAGTIGLRIDDDTNLADAPVEDFGNSASISSDGWVCFPSVTNPTITATTTYYIGVMENSGDLKWYHDSAAEYGSGQGWVANSGWTLGENNPAIDMTFRVYYCD